MRGSMQESMGSIKDGFEESHLAGQKPGVPDALARHITLCAFGQRAGLSRIFALPPRRNRAVVLRRLHFQQMTSKAFAPLFESPSRWKANMKSSALAPNLQDPTGPFMNVT